MLFQTMSQLGDTFQGIIKISNGKVQILDASHIRGALLERLVFTAAFHERVEMRGTARWLIKMFSPAFGIELEENTASQQASPLRGPTIQITGMHYDVARTLFRTACTHQLKTITLICASKKQAGDMASFAAAALQEGFQGNLIFKEETVLNTSQCDIRLETRVQKSQGNKKPTISATENPETHMLYIEISVFSEEVIVSEKQEQFLWELSSSQCEEISAKIGEALKPQFKKYNRLDSLLMIQKKKVSVPKTLTLRDEITAAIAESDSGGQQPFSAPLSALSSASLKTQT